MRRGCGYARWEHYASRALPIANSRSSTSGVTRPGALETPSPLRSSVHSHPCERAGAGACSAHFCAIKFNLPSRFLVASRPLVALDRASRVSKGKTRTYSHLIRNPHHPTNPPPPVFTVLVCLYPSAPPPRVAVAYNTPSLVSDLAPRRSRPSLSSRRCLSRVYQRVSAPYLVVRGF